MRAGKDTHFHQSLVKCTLKLLRVTTTHLPERLTFKDSDKLKFLSGSIVATTLRHCWWESLNDWEIVYILVYKKKKKITEMYRYTSALYGFIFQSAS